MDLPTLWFWIIAFLFIGYFVLDGFDFGVGMALPILGRDNVDRRVLINTIGPVWDLNETWVIVAGACLFAAFPDWYATVFSGFYLPLLLILLALIARGVSFEYRHQGEGDSWRARFDAMIVVGSVVPAFLWGVAFANIARGLPLDAGHNYTGTLFDLLNPYALLGGVTTLLLFFAHGLVFIALKTAGEIRGRARRCATAALVVTIPVAAAFLVCSGLNRGGVAFWVFAAVATFALVGALLANIAGAERTAFGLMAITIGCAVLALFASLYPDLLPGTSGNGLTIYNAASSEYTLTIMGWTALIFLPLVLVYQGWTYWVFRKRITRSQIESAHDAAV